MLKRKIRKVGTSLSIVIPSAIAELMGINEGSDVDIGYENEKIIISKPAKMEA